MWRASYPYFSLLTWYTARMGSVALVISLNDSMIGQSCAHSPLEAEGGDEKAVGNCRVEGEYCLNKTYQKGTTKRTMLWQYTCLSSSFARRNLHRSLLRDLQLHGPAAPRRHRHQLNSARLLLLETDRPRACCRWVPLEVVQLLSDVDS